MIICKKSILSSLIFYFVSVNNENTVQVLCIQPAIIRRTTDNTSPTIHLHVPVLFESSRVLIIHKPHGIGHHDESSSSQSLSSSSLSSSSSGQQPGILQILRKQRKQRRGEEEKCEVGSNNDERLYGIHRLDKVTSGILVFAKDKSTASILSKYFAEKKIDKIYFGISGKKPKKKKQGLVEGGMKRSRNKGWILVRNNYKDKRNKSNNFAKTRFFTAIINSNNNSNGGTGTSHSDIFKTVIMFRPITGKTHQLRVAAKSMGIPLLGDPIYKDGKSINGKKVVHNMKTRTMLHASGIHIPKFLDHEEINIWCPPTFLNDNYEDLDSIHMTSILSNSLAKVVQKLMTKNCDVDGILKAMNDGKEISATLQ
mmetsp:Transcript_3139/g.3542  ORF Transcript_3139/g.3542 Transcript_3139/m.3542 type:complete len:368 (+) Transcript_3139:64-1167(+)